MKFTCRAIALFVTITSGLHAADPPPWAVPSAHLRLRLERDPGSPWPAAVAQCRLSPGALAPECTAITVTRTDGGSVASTVLWARTGQPMTLVFDTLSKATSFYAYVESSVSSRATNQWRPQAGVLLETRTLNQPAFDSRTQFDAAWNAATGTYGRSFRNDIFEGLHPHGPGENFLGRYEAWFLAGKPGDYAFATLSDDASFLSIDGKPVAEWPGIHGTDGGRYSEKKGQLHLEPGLHLLRYDLAQSNGTLAAVASWRQPGMNHFEVMPPQAFAPVARFTCQAAESAPGLRSPAHFEWRLTRSARMDRALLAAVAFRAMPAPDATYRWSFGDGTSGDGITPEHVYIGPGRRQVRLEIRPTQGVPLTIEQAVDVHPAWDQIEECPDSALDPLKAAIRSRNPKSLSMTELETVAIFASAVGDRAWLDEAGSECLSRKSGFSPGFAPILYSAGLAFRHPQFHKYAEADAMFTLALTRIDGPETNSWRARISLLQAETRLDGLRNAESALAVLATLRDDNLDGFSRRQKNLITADAQMTQGHSEDALRLYRALEPSEKGTVGAIHLQARLVAAADFVRREEWDTAVEKLEAILTDYPLERFSGSTGLLLMEARTGRGSLVPALALGERLLNANLLDDTRASLLLRLSNLHQALGDKAASARYRALLKKDYPYSEAAASTGKD